MIERAAELANLGLSAPTVAARMTEESGTNVKTSYVYWLISEARRLGIQVRGRRSVTVVLPPEVVDYLTPHAKSRQTSEGREAARVLRAVAAGDLYRAVTDDA